MERLALCISCLNGEWTAAGFRKGAPANLWQSPTSIEDFATSAAVFRESFAQVRPDGRMVGLVLAHPRLTDQVVDIPPVKGWKLKKFLDRRVQQIKAFEGDAAWSHQRAMPVKGTDAALVHLFPKAMLDHLAAGCAEAGGQLLRVIPSTAVLAPQLKELPIEKAELALIAAETGQNTTVIIGRRDGRVCLGRVLRGSWALQADRVAVDLTRTIGFAEQQTGLTVNSVWLFGAGAEARQADVQKLLRPTVRLSPVPFTSTYWASQAASLAASDDGNLVAAEDREAPQRRRFLTLTSASLVLMLLASAGAATYAKQLVAADRTTIKKLDAEIRRWHVTRAEWQARHAEAARKRELVRLISEEKPLPLPRWLLGQLGESSPPDLLLTSLDVERTNDAWTIRLAGTTQPPTNDIPLVLDRIVGQFTTNLATGPFHMRIARTSFGGTPAAAESATTRLVGASTNLNFQVEGVIR